MMRHAMFLVPALAALLACEGEKKEETATEPRLVPAEALAAEAKKETPSPEPQWGATPEMRDQWIAAACAGGCDESQRKTVRRFARSARLEPVERGIRVTGIQAYSPWTVCRIQNGDLVLGVDEGPVDHARLLRACVKKKGRLKVLRGGEEITFPAGRPVPEHDKDEETKAP